MTPTALSGALNASVWNAWNSKVTFFPSGTDNDFGPNSAMTLSDIVSKLPTDMAVVVVAVAWAIGVIRVTTSLNCLVPAAVTLAGVSAVAPGAATVRVPV